MRTATLLLALTLIGCGAKSALRSELYGSDAGSDVGADIGPDSASPCPRLASFVGRFAGNWSGVVNCLEEKHATQGTLTFEGHADVAGNVRIDGRFSGTFFNGKALRSRVLGVLYCVGGPSVDLVEITVGQAQVGQTLSGWLKGWSDQGGQLAGTWRVDQWEPLCIGAGSWQAGASSGH